MNEVTIVDKYLECKMLCEKYKILILARTDMNRFQIKQNSKILYECDSLEKLLAFAEGYRIAKDN
jgi:hypothetical protein